MTSFVSWKPLFHLANERIEKWNGNVSFIIDLGTFALCVVLVLLKCCFPGDNFSNSYISTFVLQRTLAQAFFWREQGASFVWREITSGLPTGI